MRRVWVFGAGFTLGLLLVGLWMKRLARTTPDVLRSAGFLALLVASLGCGTEPVALQPVEGEYAMTGFHYTNGCAQPTVDGRATDTLVLDYAQADVDNLRWFLTPATDRRGVFDAVVGREPGLLRVRFLWGGKEQVAVLLVGPLFGQYAIASSDTLYLLDVSPLQQGGWLTLLRFGQYRDGVLFASVPWDCGRLEAQWERVGPVPEGHRR